MPSAQTPATVADWGRLYLQPGSIELLSSLYNPLNLDLLHIINYGGAIVVNIDHLGNVNLNPGQAGSGGGGTAGGQVITLGRAAPFAILAATTITNSGNEVVTGQVGLSPGTSVVGFPPGVVIDGITNAPQIPPDPNVVAAQIDALALYIALQNAGPATILNSGALDGRTLTPGIYRSSTQTSLLLGVGQTLTLNGAGIYIFQTPSSTVTLGVDSVINLTGGASASNVFWQVGSSATINTRAVAPGTFVALSSISTGTDAKVTGRLFGLTGAVTLLGGTTGFTTLPGSGAGATVQCLFGVYQTRLYPSASPTIANYFADAFSQNNAQQDIIQLCGQGGNGVWHCDYTGTAFFT